MQKINNVSYLLCISCLNLLQRALNRLYIVQTSYEVCTKYPKRWQTDFNNEKKTVLMSRCLTRTSDNSKYFLWSHRLRVNEFQLYIDCKRMIFVLCCRQISHFMYDVPYPSPQRPRILVQVWFCSTCTVMCALFTKGSVCLWSLC